MHVLNFAKRGEKSLFETNFPYWKEAYLATLWSQASEQDRVIWERWDTCTSTPLSRPFEIIN